MPVNKNQVITITYSGKPRIAPKPPWNGGFVWKKKRFKHWIGVACEHLGSSSWWPSKDHLSEKPDSMDINIQVPNGYQAIANGNLRTKNAFGEKYTNFSWHVSYPINSYNVTSLTLMKHLPIKMDLTLLTIMFYLITSKKQRTITNKPKILLKFSKNFMVNTLIKKTV